MAQSYLALDKGTQTAFHVMNNLHILNIGKLREMLSKQASQFSLFYIGGQTRTQ